MSWRDFLQDRKEDITDLISKLENKFINTFIYPHNRVKISTLPSSWVDKDDVLLHASFQILVDFVEIELARMTLSSLERDSLWFFQHWTYRNPQRGLDYIESMIDGSDPEIPTHQVEAYEEILELYLWWVRHRDQRPDAFDASGYHAQTRNTEFEIREFGSHLDKFGPALREASTLNQKYYDEDTLMLKRLMDIRPSLWT